MSGFVAFAADLVRIGMRIHERKWSFTLFFAVLFCGNVFVLHTADALPTLRIPPPPVKVTLAASAVVSEPEAMLLPEFPSKIEIPSIGIAVAIENPTATSISALDKALLKGAVRYPTSAKLGEEGNVVLFGHSSYLPVVGNPAYKTFNGIQKLKAGDSITVFSLTRAYTYRVRSMVKVSANDGAISLAPDGKVLTLSTCDSFGAKTDRFVVTADFVESKLFGV